MLYDFAFVYEVKNRELESILLLKCELEKRGYKIYIIETWERQIKYIQPVNAKVIVSFALYNNSTLNFISSYVEKCEKIINLQWEQIYTNGDAERENLTNDTSYGIRGNAINAVHVCWGEHNYKKLTVLYGVNTDNAILSGSVSLDFLRKEFDSFYLDKKTLLEKYKINSDEKVYLFISSFSYINLPKSILDSSLYQNVGFDINEFVAISMESQNRILGWFEKELVKHPEITIVYRPHPAENDNPALLRLEKKYENFKVISDFSIKQWIIRVDKIYTWWSTSVAEIYAAGRGCEILRPVEIPYKAELENMNKADFVNTFELFDSKYSDCYQSFPIPKDVINSYYLIDEMPAYIKLVDRFEMVLKNDSYRLEGVKACGYKKPQKLKQVIKNVLLGDFVISRLIQNLIGTKLSYHGRSYSDLAAEYQYSVKMAKSNRASKREMENIENRIRNCISGVRK